MTEWIQWQMLKLAEGVSLPIAIVCILLAAALFYFIAWLHERLEQ